MKKRILSAFLSGAIILSLVACNTDGSVADDVTTGAGEINQTAIDTGIEQHNYGKNVNIAAVKSGLFHKYFAPNDDMTDILNKAIYERQLEVEEYLGVTITYDFIGDWTALYPALTTAISTNDDLYQIALNHCIRDNANLITDNMILDLNELDIDFTGEWFNQKANDSLSVAGKQFFCISDYMLPTPNAFLFNKDLIEKHHLEDPYQLVRDGKWTIDKLAEMSHAATADNGDTIWDENDTYGFVCPDNWYTVSFIYGADVDLITRNDENEFELSFGDERTYTLVEKLDALINSPDTYVNSIHSDKEVPIDSGRFLFTMYSLSGLDVIRDADINFGIIPYPKLDEAQENYISNDWGGLLCVPISLNEESYTMVGDVIELLAYHSEEEVIPAYIDVTLGIKLARDDESREMIKIIFDGCTFNSGLNYFGNTTGPFELVYSIDKMIIHNGGRNLASFLATYGPAAKAAINGFNDAVKNLE